ncbi:GntR family transcriptional regulator, partial [Ruminococcus sp.]|uniref:GntR family transcriptional regulator n=1 Tax=Ruminococcus sp. TaxID=41978 RepID=UPI0025DC0EA4
GGDQLPSVRSLSDECDINVNTVIKAYDTLIKEGYVGVYFCYLTQNIECGIIKKYFQLNFTMYN